MTDAPAPSRFDEPWQADLFALTVALSEAGHFTWADWTRAFGATLKTQGAFRPLDGGQDYYRAWLDTLEQTLAATGHASETEARRMKDAWAQAYLSTPHGQPVRLAP